MIARVSGPRWGTPEAIYELDKRSAELCRDMSIVGFAFDAPRAREMLALLEGEEGGSRRRLNEACGRKVSALSVKDLGRAFFSKRPEGFGAPVLVRSEMTGRPSLSVDAMRGYAACADERLRAAALAVLDVRRARKVRSTYILRPLVQLGADGRIHPTWNNAGPVSGRWSCQDPNLMNLPRPENDPTLRMGGIRALYVARPGCVLVSFDKSQLEMRVAAYASGDPAMIAACESRDLHGGNAAVIFGASFNLESYLALKAAHADTPEFRQLSGLRTLAKSAGFAVCYMASADTVYVRIVASGQEISLRAVEAMLAKLHRGFRVYFEWQEKRRLDAIRKGYTDEPVTGRRRWLGHDPSLTECANHPIQGGAAGVMNLELPRIVARMRQEIPAAHLVAQVHDAGYFEVPEAPSAVEKAQAIIREESEREVLLVSSGLRARFPSDIHVGHCMAA
jgi:DNA polymerase I